MKKIVAILGLLPEDRQKNIAEKQGEPAEYFSYADETFGVGYSCRSLAFSISKIRDTGKKLTEKGSRGYSVLSISE